MKLTTASWLLLALTPLATGSPTTRHVVHERRLGEHPVWERLDRAPADFVLNMKLALKETNLDLGPAWLDQVSSPSSNKYGQHWTPEQIRKAFRPRDKTIAAARAWLSRAGITSHQLSSGHNWLRFNATVAKAETLLNAKYHTFQHPGGGIHIACDEYSLPDFLQEHIDFVTPTLHFDIPTQQQPKYAFESLEKRPDPLEKRGRPTAMKIGTTSVIKPTMGSLIDISSPFLGLLDNCDQATVPNCLRSLYSIPTNPSPFADSTFGIVEYTPNHYVESDLDMFLRNFTPAAVGARPVVENVDTDPLNYTVGDESTTLESNLDLQYAMSLTYPHNVTLYQVGDSAQSGSFNSFLDALDASYCTYEGGDDPGVDQKYPDDSPGGYASHDCGTAPVAKVISTSYGYNEADLTPAYATRQCNEYMKLGLMGTTFLFASGDDGVGTNCPNNRFQTTFPSTCPWVLAVGATMVRNNTNVAIDGILGTEPEVACEDVIHSGGGFSDLFGIPDYQRAAVGAWFADHPAPYSAAQFNNSGNARAYPDVAANGARYVTAINGEYVLTYGSSAATPVFGAVLTLLNDERMRLGKSPVGFVNPALYQNPFVLNDISGGRNPGCGTDGFEAVAGWDPVTGLGTPNYNMMLGLFLALP